jgi:amino acid transporter
MSEQAASLKKFGTTPVFLTSICTILGAILFLRFGWAVGQVGLLATIGIVVVGHLVTIPTSLAIAEIATNQRVEGGGAYYIISRSFGLNIGGAIGIALYLSQAISVAFYVIAFAESFNPLLAFAEQNGFDLSFMKYLNPNTGLYAYELRWVSIPAMLLLAALVLTRGANSGMNLLYFVAAVLGLSLILFFLGDTDYEPGSLSEILTGSGYDVNKLPENASVALKSGRNNFFTVFTIIFPAFTGIIAGLGLSGDLKDPGKSIPQGTLWATVIGMVIYLIVAVKLAYSLPPEILADKDRLVMADIAIWYPIIPIGLAAATISSALGSILVAPRTLQALGIDGVIPGGMSDWLGELRPKDQEPVHGGLVTVVIAFVFVALGNVDFVAEIIAMFFMVTYGAICLISFLEYFASDPAYRPLFSANRWYISLIGAILCIFLMFKMKPSYAWLSLFLMVGFYWWISRSGERRGGMARIFEGVILQISRSIRVMLQKQTKQEDEIEETGESRVEHNWTPSAICISRYSFDRLGAFDLLRFISHRYGFGTYIHLLEGYYSKATVSQSKDILRRLLVRTKVSHSNVYIDTLISPSYTSAVAQTLQLPGISGQDNNMIVFEYSQHQPQTLVDVVENYGLLKAADFDVCILRTTEKGFGYKNEIHIWISSEDFQNSNLKILLAYIILGHPEWKRGVIKIFAVYPETQLQQQRGRLLSLINDGRLAISPNNISFIPRKEGSSLKSIVIQNSSDADLTILGFRREAVTKNQKELFEGYGEMGNILFVNTDKEKAIV